MNIHRVIYSSEWNCNSSEVNLSINKFNQIIYHIVRVLGGGILGFAVIGLAFSFYPILNEEIAYKFKVDEEKSRFGSILTQIYAENVKATKEEANKLGIDSYFSAYIPKIDAKANIISNVDPGNKNEYLEALENGIAHAKGTYFPGQGKSIYLFSHSTDSFLNFAKYNAVFYLLNKLEKGDTIFIYFLDKKYEYQVTEKIIASPDDVSWLQNESQYEELILQTCDPPGTNWNRLIVVAKSIS